jgi:hypothetical protein
MERVESFSCCNSASMYVGHRRSRSFSFAILPAGWRVPVRHTRLVWATFLELNETRIAEKC